MSLKTEDPNSWTFQAVDQKKLKKYNHNADRPAANIIKLGKEKHKRKQQASVFETTVLPSHSRSFDFLAPTSNINKIQDRDKKNRKT